MPKLHTCHLPDITTLFCIDIAVSNISEPGGRR